MMVLYKKREHGTQTLNVISKLLNHSIVIKTRAFHLHINKGTRERDSGYIHTAQIKSTQIRPNQTHKQCTTLSIQYIIEVHKTISISPKIITKVFRYFSYLKLDSTLCVKTDGKCKVAIF